MLGGSSLRLAGRPCSATKRFSNSFSCLRTLVRSTHEGSPPPMFLKMGPANLAATVRSRVHTHVRIGDGS
jgi:hypothetical protein